MRQKKVYDNEFKVQAVKLGREIGFSKAAKERKRQIKARKRVWQKILCKQGKPCRQEKMGL